MQSWLAKKLISYVMSRTRDGDIRPTLLMDADDVQLHLPGRQLVGRRVPRQGGGARLAAAAGPRRASRPTPTRWCSRASRGTRPSASAATTTPTRPSGEQIYENRFVIWGRLEWGRLKDYEVYEDTEKATALDGYLAEHRPAELAAA